MYPPPSCTQSTITLPAVAYGQLRQALAFASDEQHRTYSMLRSYIEGINGIAKDGSYSNLANASRPGVRGTAAQSMLVAFMLAASNIKLLSTFHRKAKVKDGAVMVE
ncbi:MAG: hypothetical protein JWM05_1009 [Acidimicrobiales bacterium]|nr:hypothetical protein [Acidimicrobiales bacterium]